MANETQIGQLVIDLKIKTEALEKGLETAKNKFKQLEEENKKVQSSNSQLDASFITMSASIIASLTKVSSIIKNSVEEYKEYTQAMSSLENVSQYTGESMDDFSKIMNKFSNYMTKSDMATTIKNFSLMGMTAKQTEQMMEALTNSAIRNRNANYTVSEAVRVASEGYKQGLSTLSDSAGVTENLSVMQSKYAESIGKTVGQLTEAEINQAYLTRTMEAAAPFASAMANYTETLAGKEGEYAQAMRETQVAYAEALEPTLIKLEVMKTTAIKTLGSFISSNETATVGVTTFILTLGTLVIGITAVKKAYDLYKTSAIAATISTQGFTAALMSNPFGALAVAISLVVSALAGYTSATEKQAEAQKVLNERTQQYNDILSGKTGYTETEISNAKQRVSEIEQEISLLNQIIKKRAEAQHAERWGGTESEAYKKANEELKELLQNYKEISKEEAGSNQKIKETLGTLNGHLIKYKNYISEANAVKKISEGLDTDTIKKKQKEAAQLKINANQMQKYLDVVKKGDKSTTEYQTAIKKLSDAYPEAANAEGIIINQAQDYINAEQLKADTAWKASQDNIKSYMDMINAALQSEDVQMRVAENIGISFEKIKPKLEGVLNILKIMAGYQPEQVPDITPTIISDNNYSSSSSTYQNKALDNYKKQIEHKKTLDQISIQQEISMYKTALRKYAKTADEKNEIREKIYELNKELAQKEKELLEQQTEDYENYIQDQKNAKGAAYDINEQTADYNKIIQMHRKYLKQIMKDERLSLDERKEIYREELNTIRDYEQQKRDLRVEQIDNTVTQLTNAITKQLEEMQEKDKSFIDAQIEEVEKLKEIRINAINAEYDAKIEAIEKELEALDKAEQQKSRDEEDAEYERKKNRLQQLIDYEHDATTKANYQKELDKLVAEYQKTLDSRTLEDKKEALNAQKDLLKEEQDDKTQAIEDETDKQKELYNKQLEDLEDYYSKQIDKAQETAEKMLLNVEQNQDKILSLLKSYGDAYEITGQTLGEKLAQGINEGITNKIENMIQRVQDSINAGIENKIKEWTSGMYRYEEGSNKPQTQTINVYQTNNIEQNPEMPSETYRKLRNIDEQLASGLAGM